MISWINIVVNKKNLDKVDVIVTRSHRPSTMGYELPRIVQAVANKWGKSGSNANPLHALLRAKAIVATGRQSRAITPQLLWLDCFSRDISPAWNETLAWETWLRVFPRRECFIHEIGIKYRTSLIKNAKLLFFAIIFL